jgi:hypothetical protein
MCRSRGTIFPANSFWQKNRHRDSFMTKVLHVDSFMTEASAAQVFFALADRRSLNFYGRIEASPHVGAIAANRSRRNFPDRRWRNFSQHDARVAVRSRGTHLFRRDSRIANRAAPASNAAPCLSVTGRQSFVSRKAMTPRQSRQRRPCQVGLSPWHR